MQAVVIHAPKDLRIGEMTLPVNAIVTKELQLRGTFRFDPEFERALRLMAEGLIDVKPPISAALPFASAVEASSLPATGRNR
jgi:L-idonate 5-dehydrogenase